MEKNLDELDKTRTLIVNWVSFKFIHITIPKQTL